MGTRDLRFFFLYPLFFPAYLSVRSKYCFTCITSYTSWREIYFWSSSITSVTQCKGAGVTKPLEQRHEIGSGTIEYCMTHYTLHRKGQFTRCDLSARFVGHDKSGNEAVYVQSKHCTHIFYSQNFIHKTFWKIGR